MKKYTPDELRSMPADKVLSLIEKSAGVELPVEFGLEFALAAGAGDTGVTIVDSSPFGRATYTQTIDWDALAKIVNREDPDLL